MADTKAGDSPKPKESKAAESAKEPSKKVKGLDGVIYDDVAAYRKAKGKK